MCPSPGWSVDKVKEAGYDNPDYFYEGYFDCIPNANRTKSKCPIGWNGKYGNVTYQKLGLVNLTDIVKSVYVSFLDDEIEWEYKKIQDIEAIFLQEGYCFLIDIEKYVNKTNIQKRDTKRHK